MWIETIEGGWLNLANATSVKINISGKEWTIIVVMITGKMLSRTITSANYKVLHRFLKGDMK